MKVIVAPDSFKGSLDARAVAESIRAGWLEVWPDDEVTLSPIADGGEGTLDAFQVAFPEAERVPVRVIGPDGREVDADWLRLPASEGLPGGVGVVELASTSGITLLDPLKPFDAHTYGFGQAIRAALDSGVSRLLLAIGGSSSTDGGAGALQALGARLLDADGHELRRGNRGLAELASLDLTGLVPLPRAGAQVLTDVTNPLLGENGTAVVFGPQKGAAPDDVPLLERNLRHLAELAGAAADPEEPGVGAAGGTAFGLTLWGARLSPGAAAVAEAIGLPQRVAGCDLVITGEGRYDSQSAQGKAPSYVAGLARAAEVPVALVAGAILAPTPGFAAAQSLTELAGGAEASMAEPSRWLAAAARLLAERWSR